MISLTRFHSSYSRCEVVSNIHLLAQRVAKFSSATLRSTWPKRAKTGHRVLPTVDCLPK